MESSVKKMKEQKNRIIPFFLLHLLTSGLFPTMTQKAHSSVVIFHSSVVTFVQFSCDFSQFSCDFSQFSCDFYSSVVVFGWLKETGTYIRECSCYSCRSCCCILGDPGAVSRAAGIFVGESRTWVKVY